MLSKVALRRSGIIFEAFHRVWQTDKASEGTGLGLDVTRKLVDLHGGQLDVEIIEHSEEYYGQFVVYYRLAGLVPPESRPKR